MQLYEFDRTTNAFNFVFEKDLEEHEIVYVRVPVVSANKRGINDIGWVSDGDVVLFGTLAKDFKNEKALWQEIRVNDEINKTVSFIKIVNNGAACRIEMRAIFN